MLSRTGSVQAQVDTQGLLVLTWVVYLALPFSLHPSFVILPFATLFAFSVAVTAGTFKKYL